MDQVAFNYLPSLEDLIKEIVEDNFIGWKFKSDQLIIMVTESSPKLEKLAVKLHFQIEIV